MPVSTKHSINNLSPHIPHKASMVMVMNQQISEPQSQFVSVPNAPRGNQFVASKDLWPQSLKDFIARSFEACEKGEQGKKDRDKVQDYLREIIIEAKNRGDMLTRRWDLEPLLVKPRKHI
eukprot:UC4_evm1s1432